MRRARTFLALLMAALWLPVTSHCLLEAAGLVPSAFQCTDTCPQSGSTSPDDADSCASVESAAYKLNDERAVTITPPLVLALLWITAAPDTLQPSELAPCSLSIDSPDLPGNWQFLQRTALPVRAPSLAS